MHPYTGQCLCGNCEYTIYAKNPGALYFCHCSRCRKETGALFGATAFLKHAELIWNKASDQLSQFHLEHTRKNRVFCKTCGCPLPRREGDNLVILPVGTLDDDSTLEPTAHIFLASRSSLENKMSEVKCFDELPG